jgi:hypothetical protein
VTAVAKVLAEAERRGFIALGDKPGHPFRGNQYGKSAGSVGRVEDLEAGDYVQISKRASNTEAFYRGEVVSAQPGKIVLRKANGEEQTIRYQPTSKVTVTYRDKPDGVPAAPKTAPPPPAPKPVPPPPAPKPAPPPPAAEPPKAAPAAPVSVTPAAAASSAVADARPEGWRSTMSAEEAAKIQDKNGANYRESVYHLTTPAAAEAISQTGFKVDHFGGGTHGTVYGTGVYSNVSAASNLKYRPMVAPKGPAQQLEMKVLTPVLTINARGEDKSKNLTLTGVFHNGGFPPHADAKIKAFVRKRQDDDGAVAEATKKKLGPIPDHVVGAARQQAISDRQHAINVAISEARGLPKALHHDARLSMDIREAIQAQGYGGILVKTHTNDMSRGGSQLVVFNPQHVAIVGSQTV